MKGKKMKLPSVRKITAGMCFAGMAFALACGQRLLRAQVLTLGNAQLQATAVSYSGQATLVTLSDIHNFPSPIVIGDTGPLPSSGGTLEVSILDTNVDGGALTFDTAKAFTTGDGSEARSDTSINDFQLQIMATNGMVTILTADFIGSEALATCKQNGSVSVSASVDIENLFVNGQQIHINGQPNQVIVIPGGQIVINQQTSSVTGNAGDITVAALQIEVAGCMTGPIGFAHADIVCTNGAPPPPSECGKLTGGGWIIAPDGAKGTFAVSGGIRFGQFWGHLNYIDHGTGMHVTSHDVTSYTVDPKDSSCRDITYDVSIGGVPGTAM